MELLTSISGTSHKHFSKFKTPRSAHEPRSHINRFGWFVGHVTLLFCTLRYGLSYMTFNFYSGWARFSYRTAFVAAAATYGIVVYKAFRARARAGKSQQGGALALAGDENVQYLGLSPAATTPTHYQTVLMSLSQQWRSSGSSPAKSPSPSSPSQSTLCSMSQLTLAPTSSQQSNHPSKLAAPPLAVGQPPSPLLWLTPLGSS